MAGRCVSTCIQQVLSVCCVVDSLQDAGELITGLGCFTWNCFIYKIKATALKPEGPFEVPGPFHCFVRYSISLVQTPTSFVNNQRCHPRLAVGMRKLDRREATVNVDCQPWTGLREHLLWL